MTATERNAHYGKINNQHDERAAHLWALGFRPAHIADHSLSVWTVERYSKRMTIPTATLLYADSVVWADQLERAAGFVRIFG